MEVRISAVIVTYNEERDIERCLTSLVGVADEIVVVDSYSTDRTEEICRSFNVKFLKHRFFGYIEQKNWALLQASSRYILSIDADEALSLELRKSILEVKKAWTQDGYSFNRLNSYCGKLIRHTSWYPDRKLRLLDSRKGSWGGTNPHDQLRLSDGCTQKRLRGDLLHYSYYSVPEHIEKINRFSTIVSESMFRRGTRAPMYKLILHPLWRFFKDFLVKGGIWEGYFGLIISANSSYEVFLKYVKLRNLYQEQRQSQRQTICLFNLASAWGGGEKWHVDVAANLIARGYKVIFISSPGSPTSKRMDELGVPGYQLRISNLGFLNPVTVLRLVKIFKKEKVLSVVTSLPNDMKVASISGRVAGVPKILYRRGSAIPIRNSISNRFLLRKLVTKIIANSLEVKRTILANNKMLVPEDKISIVYNGVNLASFNSGNKKLYQARDQEIVLGSAGRLSEEKGHMHLIDLMKVLDKSNYRFKLLIAGKGKLMEPLMKKARELGMDERIEFMGFVQDMPAFFNSLDIFLLPSRYEGFSNAVIEAMACSKPVISFDVGSTREVIDHRISGFVGRGNSVDEMAGWILEMAGNELLRKEIGMKARERIELDFTFERGLEEIITLLSGPANSSLSPNR